MQFGEYTGLVSNSEVSVLYLGQSISSPSRHQSHMHRNSNETDEGETDSDAPDSNEDSALPSH